MARRPRRTEIAFASLVALTLGGLALSRTAIDPLLIGAALLALAAIKGRLLVLDFFGLRHAPGPWLALLLSWIAVMIVTAFAASAAGRWL